MKKIIILASLLALLISCSSSSTTATTLGVNTTENCTVTIAATMDTSRATCDASIANTLTFTSSALPTGTASFTLNSFAGSLIQINTDGTLFTQNREITVSQGNKLWVVTNTNASPPAEHMRVLRD